MSKGLEPHTKKLGHYRPHSKVRFTGELVNHKTGEVFTPPDRTKQSFLEECDINNILKQFKATGQLRHVAAQAATGRYADLPDEVDFQASMNIVLEAESAFASLPARLRNRFHNDPAEFLAFMADPRNAKEMIDLGLATDATPPPPPVQKVEIVPAEGQQGGAGGTPPAGGAKAP